MSLFKQGDYVFATDDHDMPYKRLRVIHEVTADGKYVAVPIETIIGISFTKDQIVLATAAEVSVYKPIDPRKEYSARAIEKTSNPLHDYIFED